jgi:intein/homing endonuclease
MNTHCFVGETLISLPNGTSKRIDSFSKKGLEKLWTYSEDNNKICKSHSLGSQYSGNKETIKLTLIDGRELICTPDHKFRVSENGINIWKEAKDITYDDKLLVGPIGTEDIKDDDENDWSLDMGDYKFNMKNNKQREKSLAFARLLGYILTDGTICDTINNVVSRVSMGSILDAESMLDDIELILDVRPKISDTKLNKCIANTYNIALPNKFSRSLAKLENITIGRRTAQESSFPTFISSSPKSFIREFLGGLFGGDGWCPHYSSSNKNTFTTVRFSQSTNKKHEQSLNNTLENIVLLMKKLNVNSSVCRTREYSNDKTSSFAKKKENKNNSSSKIIENYTNSNFIKSTDTDNTDTDNIKDTDTEINTNSECDNIKNNISSECNNTEINTSYELNNIKDTDIEINTSSESDNIKINTSSECDNIKNTDMVSIEIDVESNEVFRKNIGFRHCIHKLLRLEVACAYETCCEQIKIQHNIMINKVNEILDNRTQVRRIDNITLSPVETALQKARKEIYENCKPLNEYYSLLTPSLVNNRRRKDRSNNCKVFDYKYMMNAKKFIEFCGVETWFDKNTYITQREDLIIPNYNLTLLKKENNISRDVYDVGVHKHHSFFACGVNVHNSLPGRMTVAQLVECLASKEAAINGHFVDGTPFNNYDTNDVPKILKKLGYSANGTEVMYNGMTGKKIEVEIFIGPTYQVRLKHMVQDKVHGRARGPRQALTRQPLEGRSRDGGFKIGRPFCLRVRMQIRG